MSAALRLRLCGCALVLGVLAASPALAGAPARTRTAVVEYRSRAALARAATSLHARIVRVVPSLGAAELRGASLRPESLAGVTFAGTPVVRRTAAEPALAPALSGPPFEWQYAAVHEDRVPRWVQQAAAAFTIAVVDTGIDPDAPDLAAKSPSTHVLHGAQLGDRNGHGTFVASLAAGAVANGEGVAGFGGDAHLLAVKAGGDDGSFTDVDEAAAIAYAVDHGARIVNLSIGGPQTSLVEQRAIDYAVGHGALVVAAVGNEYREGNPVEYPAALLQPVGTRGAGGVGLAVAASTQSGGHAVFSNTGTHVSLAAPGVDVFGAVSSASSAADYPRAPLPGSRAGVYGFASGTSFATPEVAGAAALVWAANPLLRPAEVASILEQTASGNGAWTPELGYGVIDVARAVARARDLAAAPLPRTARRTTAAHHAQ